MSEERDVLLNRRAKMDAWLAKSKVYRNDFRRQALAAELQSPFADQDKAALAAAGARTAAYGRVLVRRCLGKASVGPCRFSPSAAADDSLRLTS